MTVAACKHTSQHLLVHISAQSVPEEIEFAFAPACCFPQWACLKSWVLYVTKPAYIPGIKHLDDAFNLLLKTDIQAYSTPLQDGMANLT